MWRRRLYAALAHLEMTGRVGRSSDGCQMTDLGRAYLDALPCETAVLDEVRRRLSCDLAAADAR